MWENGNVYICIYIYIIFCKSYLVGWMHELIELVEWMNDELDEWMVLIMKLWVPT